jgi:ribosomal protein S18 acetylase RimI-like enzyme
MVNVRPVGLADLESVAVLFDLYRQFYDKAADYSGAAGFLAQRLSKKDSALFVAESEDHKLVGFVQLYPCFSSLGMGRTFLLNDLFVVSDYRRSSVATQLIEAAHRHAKDCGALSITLETHPDNVKAQALYKKFGYQLDTEYLVMSLNLKNIE